VIGRYIISQRLLFHEVELLTNATVIDDAIKFVSGKSKDKLKSRSSNSNESDEESC
jgi:hypothetical protein